MIIKKLGIEIRKAGSLDGLYRDVDSILANNNVADGGVSVDAQASTVAHALQRMFSTESNFSVCTVDRCCAIAQIHIPAERYRIYSALHCMKWNEMEPEYRRLITAMLLDDFRSVLHTDNYSNTEIVD